MNSENNEKNVEKKTVETMSTPKEGLNEFESSLSSKGRYFALAGLLLALILGIFIGLSQQEKEELVLDGLGNVDYEVIQVNQHDDTKDYEVRLETDTTDKEVLVGLAIDMAETIRDHEDKEETKVVIGIYKDPEPGVSVESSDKVVEEEITSPVVKPSLGDENHQMTIEVTEVVKIYTLVDKSSLEKDINATANWEIYNSKYVDGKHLTGSVALPTGVSEDDVYRQLKAIESEMVRFNELPKDGATYFDYEREENVLYYGYSSIYPTSLIQIEQLEIVKEVLVNE